MAWDACTALHAGMNLTLNSCYVSWCQLPYRTATACNACLGAAGGTTAHAGRTPLPHPCRPSPRPGCLAGHASRRLTWAALQRMPGTMPAAPAAPRWVPGMPMWTSFALGPHLAPYAPEHGLAGTCLALRCRATCWSTATMATPPLTPAQPWPACPAAPTPPSTKAGRASAWAVAAAS